MDLPELLRARHMTRDFSTEPIDDVVLDRVLDLGRRVPSAGNTQGFDLVVLNGPAETSRYWDVTLAQSKRESFRWKGLLAAPVLISVWADPRAYVSRYGESDKVRTGLGAGAEAWSTPYWTVDASFAALGVQLAAHNEGLGVLFFGVFEHAEAVAVALNVPPDREAIGTIALGWPNEDDAKEPGRSAGRQRRRLDEIVHRGSW
ncbi:MAG: nitroreductase family protein [Acidimicrobiales bacterium]|jgi:nitroreductase